MAKKRIDITIAAKTKIKGALLKIKQGFAGLGKAALKAGAIAGAALGALAVKAVAAFSAQEDAVNSLNAALRANGHNVEALSPGFQKVAADIQNLTGKADESTIALMAQMANLGVQPQRMEEAAKGAIGLGKALGLSSDAAARYTALAMQGEFTILQRYVPALREATSEAEKQAIVNDLMAGGFQQAQDALKTTSGRWAEFRGRIGDAMEEVGAAIVGNEDLGRGLADLSDKIKVLIESGQISAWAKNAMESVKSFSSAIGGAVTKVVKFVKNYQLMLELAARLAQFQGPKEAAAAMIEREKGKELQKNLDRLKAQRKQKERAAKAEADEARATASAEKDREASANARAAAADQAKADSEAAAVAQSKVVEGLNEEKSAIESTAKARDKALQNEIAGLDKSITKRASVINQLEKIAGMAVGEFIENQKAGKAAEKAAARKERRIARIRKKQGNKRMIADFDGVGLREAMGMNTKLTKADQEFIDAVDAQEAAQQKLVAEQIEQQNAQRLLKDAQDARDLIAQQSKDELVEIRKKLNKALNVGGQA